MPSKEHCVLLVTLVLSGAPEFASAVGSTVKAQLQPSVGSELAEVVDHALDTPESVISEANSILGLDGR